TLTRAPQPLDPQKGSCALSTSVRLLHNKQVSRDTPLDTPRRHKKQEVTMVFFSSWWYNWWYGTQKLKALDAYASRLPETGPYDSVQLGMLKKLDQMVSDLEMPSGIQVHLVMVLRERAMTALPKDTAALLKGNLMSSEIALELVRRDMTEYSQLSSGLYGSKPEDLDNDPPLKRIHDRLSMAVELHGVLTLAGITPTEREWAQALADTFVDLRSLRGTPWSEVAWLLGLVELTPKKKAQSDKANAEQGLPVLDGVRNTFDNPPTSTELRIVKELYSIGDGAPPIRAQVLHYRMSLDVADELENMGIYDASQITASDQRRLLLRAKDKVEAEEEEVKDAEKKAADQKLAARIKERAEAGDLKSSEEAPAISAQARREATMREDMFRAMAASRAAARTAAAPKKAAEDEEAKKTAELADADRRAQAAAKGAAAAAAAAQEIAQAEAGPGETTSRGLSVPDIPSAEPPVDPLAIVPAADAGGAEGSPQHTSRSISLFAAAAKAGTTALKVLPKLGTGTKLTTVTRSGSSGLAALGKNLSAMQANAKGAKSAASSAVTRARGAGKARSGLFNPNPQATSTSSLSPSSFSPSFVGDKLDEISSAVNSATGVVQNVKGLYNELTPDVEAQVAAIEQEKARLNKSIDYVRKELDEVDVTHVVGGNLRAAQAALNRAKAQVAPDPNFGARIAQGSSQALQQYLIDQRLNFGGTAGLGSYGSNEELAAKASGGVALYGVSFFPTTTDFVLKPYTPLLQTPSFVEMTGAVSPFEAKVEKTTSLAKASAFHNTSSNAGISVAETISTTKGASTSGSFGSMFASASASARMAKGTTVSEQKGSSDGKNTAFAAESTTKSATIIEYIRCPMKSFRIPVSHMDLSAGAFAAALLVDNIDKGDDFLDNYGSHISTGRQELGGIFFSTISVTSENAMSKVSMMTAASTKSQTMKSESKNTEGGVRVKTFLADVKASASFGKATSVGEVKVTTKAKKTGEAEEVETAQYESYVRSIGPSSSTPESFAEALFTDTSTWAITDRGRLEAMVPVTVVLQKAVSHLRASSGADQDPVVKGLERAVLFVKAAWRRRAKRWSYLLSNTPDLNVPTPVINLLKSAFPSSLGRVPTLLKALLDSLVIKHTDLVRRYRRSETLVNRVRLDVILVAQTVVAASKKAEENENHNSVPVELSFLDAAEVEKQVNANLTRLKSTNTGRFAALTLTYNVDVGRFTLARKARDTLWDASAEKKKRDDARAAAAGTPATDTLKEEQDEEAKEAYLEATEDLLAAALRRAWEADVPLTGNWATLAPAEQKAFIAARGSDAKLSDTALGRMWDATVSGRRIKWSALSKTHPGRSRFTWEKNKVHVEQLWRVEAAAGARARERWENPDGDEKNKFVVSESGLRALW
ncbi:unnamed protein product, partial [Ectocarpus fasciculatus]